MKKSTVITSIILALSLNANMAQAKGSSTEEDVGFFSGAIAGAIVGGPVGFFVGGVSGVIMGKQVNKANQLDDIKVELATQVTQYKDMQEKLVSVRQQVTKAVAELNNPQWLTKGLTLNLMFETNSAMLSKTDKRMIQRLSEVLNEYPELNIKLDGYADPRGDEATNMTLSQARTKAVQNEFTAQGIDIKRLNLHAHGESLSKVETNSLDAYALERRVSINFFTDQVNTVAQN